MWVVTVHNGGGSMVEAADPEFVAGFAIEKSAKDFEKGLDSALRHNSYTRDDWWTQCFEVPDVSRLKLPTPTAAQVAQLTGGKGLGPGQIATDMDALVIMLADGDEIELLPEPVSKEDEQAAIDSILKGLT